MEAILSRPQCVNQYICVCVCDRVRTAAQILAHKANNNMVNFLQNTNSPCWSFAIIICSVQHHVISTRFGRDKIAAVLQTTF